MRVRVPFIRLSSATDAKSKRRGAQVRTMLCAGNRRVTAAEEAVSRCSDRTADVRAGLPETPGVSIRGIA